MDNKANKKAIGSEELEKVSGGEIALPSIPGIPYVTIPFGNMKKTAAVVMAGLMTFSIVGPTMIRAEESVECETAVEAGVEPDAAVEPEAAVEFEASCDSTFVENGGTECFEETVMNAEADGTAAETADPAAEETVVEEGYEMTEEEAVFDDPGCGEFGDEFLVEEGIEEPIIFEEERKGLRRRFSDRFP